MHHSTTKNTRRETRSDIERGPTKITHPPARSGVENLLPSAYEMWTTKYAGTT